MGPAMGTSADLATVDPAAGLRVRWTWAFVLGELVGFIPPAVVGTAHAQTSFRFSSEAPRSDTQFQAATRMNEILKAKTNGALDLKIFTDSQLGTFQAAIAGVRGGTIDMAVSGSGNFTGLVPLIGVLDIPFLFRDSKHAYTVLDGPILHPTRRCMMSPVH